MSEQPGLAFQEQNKILKSWYHDIKQNKENEYLEIRNKMMAEEEIQSSQDQEWLKLNFLMAFLKIGRKIVYFTKRRPVEISQIKMFNPN